MLSFFIFAHSAHASFRLKKRMILLKNFQYYNGMPSWKSYLSVYDLDLQVLTQILLKDSVWISC